MKKYHKLARTYAIYRIPVDARRVPGPDEIAALIKEAEARGVRV